MPYIKQERRGVLFPYDAEIDACPETAGELNYVITEQIIQYLGKEYNYQKINDVLGALEGAKLELYRRLAVPYEDLAIERNGDVYT